MFFYPIVADGYEWIQPADPDDYEVFHVFNGRRLARGWVPIRMRRVLDNGDEIYKPSDFPWLGSHALIFGRKAIDAMRAMLDQNGELLPLAVLDGTVAMVLNAQVVNALDESSSVITRYPDGRIMLLDKPCFRLDVVRGLDIFRLPFRASPTYVSEAFVKRVTESRLVGLTFRQVDVR